MVQHSGRNIVFVNFNYRVGLWGFLASERVRANSAGDLNVGLRDQIEVMRWVRRNIAQFGGDPTHVVIHGASAGAGSVALHLLMSYSNNTNNGNDEDNRPLFVGGIGESVFFPAQPAVADVEWQFDRLLSQTGCSSDEDPMSCLRSKDTSTLQAANMPSPFPGRPGLPLFYWTPCLDGDLLRDSPYTLFARGEFVDVPVMMGTTTDEGTIFASNAQTPDDVENFMRDNYPNLTDTQAANILDQYPKMAELPAHGPYVVLLESPPPSSPSGVFQESLPLNDPELSFPSFFNTVVVAPLLTPPSIATSPPQRPPTGKLPSSAPRLTSLTLTPSI